MNVTPKWRMSRTSPVSRSTHGVSILRSSMGTAGFGLACVVSDNRAGLRNGPVKTALLGAGAQVVDVRAYRLGNTPFVERMWSTMESQVINLLHGYTGRKAGHLKGYDAKKNAVILREDLFRLITRYLIVE